MFSWKIQRQFSITSELLDEKCPDIGNEIEFLNLKFFISSQNSKKQHRRKTKLLFNPTFYGNNMIFVSENLYPKDKKVAWCDKVKIGSNQKINLKVSNLRPERGIDCHCGTEDICIDKYTKSEIKILNPPEKFSVSNDLYSPKYKGIEDYKLFRSIFNTVSFRKKWQLYSAGNDTSRGVSFRSAVFFKKTKKDLKKRGEDIYYDALDRYFEKSGKERGLRSYSRLSYIQYHGCILSDRYCHGIDGSCSFSL